MAQLPHSIELHDSEISRIESIDGNVHIDFKPAYIHKDGSGWLQDIEVVIYKATLSNLENNFPIKVYDGRLKTELGPYHNLLEIPFSTEGKVEFEIETEDDSVIKINGTGVEHYFTNEPIFLEKC
ncbi:hypothetical protein [Aurantivibrio infirmus]